MSYLRDLWEIAACSHGIISVKEAEDIGVPAVEVRKLASRGALQGLGNGVYRHRDIPVTHQTQFASAVALVGDNAFLDAESVFCLLNLGDFNPRSIKVGTQKRVRRSLPEWLKITKYEPKKDLNITQYEGIDCLFMGDALLEISDEMPRERWHQLVLECERKDFITQSEVAQLEDLVTK